jgi:hypothetical protein
MKRRGWLEGSHPATTVLTQRLGYPLRNNYGVYLATMVLTQRLRHPSSDHDPHPTIVVTGNCGKVTQDRQAVRGDATSP